MAISCYEFGRPFRFRFIQIRYGKSRWRPQRNGRLLDGAGKNRDTRCFLVLFSLSRGRHSPHEGRTNRDTIFVIVLQFAALGDQRRRQIGPARSFQLIGTTLHMEDEPQAVYNNGLWRIEADHFTVLASPEPVELELADARESRRLGPSDKLRIIDGAIWASEQPKLLACLLEHLSLWHVPELGSRHRVIKLWPARQLV
jgi:hypothetical protein